MNLQQDPDHEPARNRLLLALSFVAIFSIGLIGIVHYYVIVYHVLFFQQSIQSLYEGINPFFFPNKPFQTVSYLVFSALLIPFIAIALRITKSFPSNLFKDGRKPTRSERIYSFVSIGVNFALFFPSVCSSSLSVVWLILLLYPARNVVLESLGSVRKKTAWLIFSAEIAALMGALLVNFVVPPHFNSQYHELPESTHLKGERLPVLNSKYYSDHEIFGLQLDGRARIPEDYILKGPLSNPVKDYFSLQDQRTSASIIGGSVYLNRALTDQELNFMRLSTSDPGQLNMIANAYVKLRDREHSLNSRNYTGEELEFINKNRSGLVTGFQSRDALHHVGFVTNAINDLECGAPLGEVHVQYGIGSLFLSKWISEKLHILSVRGFIQISQVQWLAYLALVAVAAKVLFRSPFMIATAMGIAAAGFFLLGYHYVMFAPGFNPLRHFMDVLVILLLARYQNSENKLLLVLSTVICLVSEIMSGQMGLFLTISLCWTLLIVSLISRSYRLTVYSLIVAAIAVSIYIKLNSMVSDPISSYYLRGLLGFNGNPLVYALMLMSFIFSYVILYRRLTSSNDPRSSILLLFLTAYAQQLLLYFVWTGQTIHFYAILPIIGLYLLYFIEQMVGELKIKINYAGLMAISTMLFLAGLSGYLIEFAKSASFSRNHVVYEWDMPKARFESSMDPEPVVKTMQMINSYSPGPSICLLSPLDNIIPFLVSKRNILPFYDMQWFIMTSEEFRLTVESIQNKSPDILFVDHCIEDINIYDVANAHGTFNQMPFKTLQDESIWRLQRLYRLHDVYAKVISDYTKIDSGPIVTVYKKNVN